MLQPYFSIITCTFNSEAFLLQCIGSVKAQQFTDYEHIIVDAFSTDNTPQLIETYAREDERVRLIQTEPRGIANAMNRGIKEARGQVIQHLHSDDYFHSDQTLSIVYEAFKAHPRKSLLIGLSSRNIDGNIRSGILPPSTFQRRRLLLPYLIYVHCYIAHPSTFIKKSVFDSHGLFREDFPIAMDYEFWLRVLGKVPYLMINRELTTFREHSDAASADHERNMEDEQRARQLHTSGFRAFLARILFSRAVALKEKQNQKIG